METKDIIFELRTKKGLSQEALAEKVFVTRQAVSRWELQKEVKMQRLKQNRAASFIAVALVYIIATVVGVVTYHAARIIRFL